jgi:hypothetical protein
VHPTVDRVKDLSFAANPVPLHKVAGRRWHRGARRILATLAPFADEIAVTQAILWPPTPLRRTPSASRYRWTLRG